MAPIPTSRAFPAGLRKTFLMHYICINKNPLFTKRCEQDFIKFNDIPQNIPSKRHIRLYLYLNWWNMTPFCIKFKRYYIWGVFLRFARKAPEDGILHGTWHMAHDYTILEVIITNIPVHVFCLYTKSYIIAVRYVFHKKSGQKIALGQLLRHWLLIDLLPYWKEE